ncbi:MAG: hypothetical protein SGI83_14215, partial [Bacteroidota bacterium]|nr:hypothetical protein [Bacteroidota bacterium]
MKIIFLIEHDHGGVIPFKHRTYFDKVDVEYDYWDLRYLKNGKRAIEPIWVANSDLIIKKIHKSDLERELSTLKESVFITGHGISRKNRFFYCLLKKYNIPYIVLI